MSHKSAAPKTPAERVVRDIRRETRKHYSAEDKIRIVLEGLRGEESIAALCRREGIAESLYYTWSKRSRAGWSLCSRMARRRMVVLKHTARRRQGSQSGMRAR
jgi:transposase